MTTPRVCIATLLRPTGETGVQTHFNTFCEWAKQNGLEDVQIVTPYAANRIIRGVVRRTVMLVGRYYDREVEILCKRQFSHFLLRRQLLAWLKTNSSSRNIIYAQDPLSAKAALVLKSHGHPMEVVLVIHFNISQAFEVVTRGRARERGRLWRNLVRLEEEVIPKVDRVIFSSRFMETQILKRIPSAVTMPRWVIPNTIKDLAHSSVCRVSGDLITIGTIEPRKNQEYLVQVLAEARRLGHKYRMTVVGDGEHKSKLMGLVSRLGMGEYVSFTGYVPHAQRLIGGHRVYAHAAVMDNLPHVLVEAMAGGKPVFAAPVGGIPEVFTDGLEGVYWSLDDPVEAARKLVKVLEDDALYNRMSKAARTKYECHFTPEVLAPKFLAAVLGQDTLARRGDGHN